MKFMLFDNRHLEKKDGFSCRVTNPGRSYTALRADQPWERCGLFGDSCMTLINDNGVKKIWYSIISPDAKQGSARQLSDAEKATLDLKNVDQKFLADILCPERYYLCYAYSNDGKNWIKPALGIYEVDGSKENNIVFGGRLGATVFIDPAAPPESRYKMIHGGSLKLPHWLNDKFVRMAYTGIYGAVSKDGIHWTGSVKPIMPHYTDTTNVCFYDEEQSKYIAYVRTDKGMIYDSGKTVMTDPDHRTYRIISRSESTDFFDFPSPVEIMEPEESEIQDYLSHWKIKNGMDFYNSSAVKYPYAEGVYFLFPSYFHHDTDEAVIHIATGRDSIHFTRHDDPLIQPENAPEFRAKQQYLACGMLAGDNDSLTIFAGSADVGHDELSSVKKHKHVITAYEFQTDGFVGQYAEKGTLTTKILPVPAGCSELKIRCRIDEGGFIAPDVYNQDRKKLMLDFDFAPAANNGTLITSQIPADTHALVIQISAEKANVYSIELT